MHPQLAAEREAERRRARGRRRLRPGRILSAPPRALARGVTAGGRGMAGAVLGALGDVLGIAREMLAWPLRILMGGAKLAGQAVLAIWRNAILPMLRLVYGASAWALRVGEREVTPARALSGELALVHATRRILESVASEPDAARLMARLRRRRHETPAIRPRLIELPDGRFQVEEPDA